MPECESYFAWYLGKFLIGFAGVLFLYVGFLKENEKSCLCDARMRELLRQENEKRPGRCECAKGTRSERYACGCSKMTQAFHDQRNVVSTNGYVGHNCVRSRCCVRRNSY